MAEDGSDDVNLMTHSFEALVRLLECLTPDEEDAVAAALARQGLDRTDDSPVALRVGAVRERAGMDEEPLPTDLVRRLLGTSAFGRTIGEGLTTEDVLARWCQPALLGALVEESFDAEQLLGFCAENGIDAPVGLDGRGLIGHILAEFELGALPREHRAGQGTDRRPGLCRDHRLAPVEDVIAAQDLADRVSAMLTKLISSQWDAPASRAPSTPPAVVVLEENSRPRFARFPGSRPCDCPIRCPDGRIGAALIRYLRFHV